MGYEVDPDGCLPMAIEAGEGNGRRWYPSPTTVAPSMDSLTRDGGEGGIAAVWLELVEA